MAQSGEQRKIRVLIVDDIPETRENLRKLLFFESDIEVVGAATNGEEGISMAGELKPDIVLMDIELSGTMDGIQAADTIRKKYQIPSIYITAICDAKTLQRVGASIPYGYILKPFKDDELRTVIDIAYEILTKKE